jgi:hypothetical protein
VKTIKDLTSIDTPNDNAEIWVQDQSAAGVDRRWSLANIATWVKSKLGTAATRNMASGVTSFGTASGRDVTTSATDATEGRVPLFRSIGGIFGLGTRNSPDMGQENLGNGTASRIRSGFYRVDDRFGTVAYPAQVNIFRTNYVAGRASEIAISINSGANEQIWWRTQTIGDTWTTPKELYHTGNYPSDTTWNTTTILLNGWTGTVRYIRRAGMVTVVLDSLVGTSATNNTILNLPAGYRPGVVIADEHATSAFSITTGGDITSAYRSTAKSLTISYPIIT